MICQGEIIAYVECQESFKGLLLRWIEGSREGKPNRTVKTEDVKDKQKENQ